MCFVHVYVPVRVYVRTCAGIGRHEPPCGSMIVVAPYLEPVTLAQHACEHACSLWLHITPSQVQMGHPREGRLEELQLAKDRSQLIPQKELKSGFIPLQRDAGSVGKGVGDPREERHRRLCVGLRTRDLFCGKVASVLREQGVAGGPSGRGRLCVYAEIKERHKRRCHLLHTESNPGAAGRKEVLEVVTRLHPEQNPSIG